MRGCGYVWVCVYIYIYIYMCLCVFVCVGSRFGIDGEELHAPAVKPLTLKNEGVCGCGYVDVSVMDHDLVLMMRCV